MTPHDVNELAEVAEGFIVGANGTAAIVTSGGSNVTITCVAGTEYRIRIRQVKATGTTATGIVALY